MIRVDEESLPKVSFGRELSYGTAVEDVWYKITARTGNSVFPAGYEIGDLIIGKAVCGNFDCGNKAQSFA